MKAKIKNILYVLCQCSWGILQSAAGFAVFLASPGKKRFMRGGTAVTVWKSSYSLSLGMFVFVSGELEGEAFERMFRHEYGHTVQSLILGPLYLPLIALPSCIWCTFPCFEKLRREKSISYYSFFTERWADILGKTSEKN